MRLLVAEDQRMLRDAMVQLLRMEDEVIEVYAAADGRDAIELLTHYAVDVALLDIEMPYRTGLDVLEWAKQQRPNVKIVIFTTFKRTGYFERAMAADVDAFVLKERSIDELMGTIRKVLAGGKDYSPELVGKMFAHRNPLSDQERELMAGVAQGLSNRELAQAMYLSEGTIRNYMSTVLHKLGAANRTEAIRIVRENGWE